MTRRPIVGRPASRKPQVVGTYRLLRQEVAERHCRLLHRGRVRHRAAARRAIRTSASSSSAAPACCKPYRDKRTVELLWHGIWTYVRHHRHRRDVRLRQPGGHRSRAGSRCRSASCTTMPRRPAEWRARGALPGRCVAMDLMRRRGDRPEGGAAGAAAADQGLSAARRDASATAPWSTASSARPTCSWSCRSRAISPRYIDHFGAGRANRHAA